MSVLLLTISFTSAAVDLSLRGILDNTDPTNLIFGALFLVIFLLLHRALKKFFKTDDEKMTAGFLALIISALATYYIYDSGYNIENFFYEIGLNSDLFALIIGLIIIGCLIYLLYKYKGKALIIIGSLILILGLLAFNLVVIAIGLLVLVLGLRGGKSKSKKRRKKEELEILLTSKKSGFFKNLFKKKKKGPSKQLKTRKGLGKELASTVKLIKKFKSLEKRETDPIKLMQIRHAIQKLEKDRHDLKEAIPKVPKDN